MNKIWIIKSRYSWRLCKSERELLKRIGKNSTLEVLEFDLKSQQKATDYLTSKERDHQLRVVLGELSEFEKKAVDLISLFEKIAPDGKEAITYNRDTNQRIISTEKASWISRLKKWQNDQKGFKQLLIDNKTYFLQISNSVEWLSTLLKCHNFLDCKMIKYELNKETNKYQSIDLSTDELKSSFVKAKELNRKKKK